MATPALRKVHSDGAGPLYLMGYGVSDQQERSLAGESMVDEQVGHCCFGDPTGMEEETMLPVYL